jgi:hypothetical protein
MREIISNIKNTKKSIFAMPEAATATPVKPKIAAIIDIIKNKITHPSIINSLHLIISNACLI